MAHEHLLQSKAFPTNGDQSANQYKFMTNSASGVAVAAASGARCIGVLQDAPSSGAQGSIAYGGTSKVVAGAAVAVNAQVQTDASGRAITAVSTGHIQGTALEAASAAGEIISVLLQMPTVLA